VPIGEEADHGRLGRDAVGTIETFDHTADVGLRVRGADLDDLFRTAAEGLFDYVVANRAEVRTDDVEKVSLREDAPADLLAAWLSELIFRSETHHRVFRDFDVRVEDAGTRLDATIYGEAIDRDRHVLDHEVKAVTRHGLSLRREGEGWVAEMILDI
jgi:SHS2 domain-containing protein